MHHESNDTYPFFRLCSIKTAQWTLFLKLEILVAIIRAKVVRNVYKVCHRVLIVKVDGAFSTPLTNNRYYAINLTHTRLGQTQMGVRQAPLSFSNSFWTSDYVTGFNTIYDKLDQGLVEDDEIIQFIKVGPMRLRDNI